MPPSIVVVGSSNTDMVIKGARLPAPGETVLGGRFFMSAGGKGANQAVAATRGGGTVTFVAKVGTDIFRQQAVQGFQQEGIDTTYVLSDGNYAWGVALILIGERAENCIAVASGANAALRPHDLKTAEQKIAMADAIFVQLEIPAETVARVAALAAQYRRLILNPAPALRLPAAGKLTPYTAVFIFSAGIFISNFGFNTILMRRPFDGPPVTYKAYFKGTFSTHAVGILGGLIWGQGNSLNLIAAGKAGPAISYGLGQGATLVVALRGVSIWKEFRNAPPRVNRFIALMFLFFIAGMALIIYAGR